MGYVFIVDGAAPASVFTEHSETGSTTDVYNFAGMSFGDEATDRYIVVGATFLSGALCESLSMTIGGVAATRLLRVSMSVDGVIVGAAIYAALVPTGASGDVVHTLTANGQGAGIAVFAVTGWAGSSFVSDDTITKPMSLSLARPAYSSVIAVATGRNSSAGDPGFHATWTGLTEASDVSYATLLGTTSANDDFDTADASFDVDVATNHTDAQQAGCMVALHN